MYSMTLCIHVLGLEPEFRAAVRALPERKGLVCDVVEDARDIPPQTLRRRDLVLLAEDAPDRLHEPSCPVVLVARGVPSLPEPAQARLEDVWCAPDAAMLAFYLNRFLDRLQREGRLRLKELCFETVLAVTPSLVWFKNREGEHFSVSRSFCKTVGKSREDVEGRGHAYIWGMAEEEYAHSSLACRESDARVLETGGPDAGEEQVQGPRGVRTFSTWKTALRDDDGVVIGTAGVARDVTDKSILSAEMEMLLKNLPFAALVTDGSNRIISVNDKFREMFNPAGAVEIGTAVCRAAGDRCADLDSVLHAELRELRLQPQANARDNVFIDIRNKEILDDGGNRLGAVVIFRDVTKEHAAKVSLEKNAYEDELTGLFNRRYFYEKVAHGVSGGGLVYLDLDRFKHLNDMYGHRAGDDCLKIVGETLKGLHRETVRLGGDEFALYLKGATPAATEAFAARIAREIRSRLADGFDFVAPSIGITQSDDAGESLDDLVRKADAAMYVNKRRRADLADLEQRLRHLAGDPYCSREDYDVLARHIESLRRKIGPYTVFAPGMDSRLRDVSSARRGR